MSSSAAPWSATQPAERNQDLEEIDDWLLEPLEEPTVDSGGVNREGLGPDDGPRRTIEV